MPLWARTCKKNKKQITRLDLGKRGFAGRDVGTRSRFLRRLNIRRCMALLITSILRLETLGGLLLVTRRDLRSLPDLSCGGSRLLKDNLPVKL